MGFYTARDFHIVDYNKTRYATVKSARFPHAVPFPDADIRSLVPREGK